MAKMRTGVTVELKWENGISIGEEYRKHISKLANAIRASSLHAVQRAMTDLKDHIQHDVYDKWEPAEYERRGESGGIIDVGRYSTTFLRDDILDMVGNLECTAVLEYLPRGDSPQWEEPANFDELISRIESQNPEYEMKKHPGNRPFWRNFMQDEVLDGILAEHFSERLFAENGGGILFDKGTISHSDIQKDSSDGDIDGDYLPF